MAKKPKSDAPTSDPSKKPNGPTARQKLMSLRDRIIRLEEEKKAIADDIKDIYQEAKSDGFDPRALRNIVKESTKTPGQRAAAREIEANTDIYRAALGMLDGTPLGDAARRKFEEEMERAARKGREDAAADEDEADSEGDASDKPAEDTEDEAREKGRKAHGDGAKITSNPYPAASRNRAAWDEGWCDADGSDGMGVPDAWRREPKDDAADDGGGK
ncbi:MAG: DUF2312 domain-containing protein [Rhodoblastus sp.]|nr:DUF2312 domain-containing protein [Rhodoblastus sp.]